MERPEAGEPVAGLVARVQQQDEGAARELVERLYPLVAKVVHSHLPRRDEPDDLMQDVFLKMFTRLDQYRGEVPFEHWVSRIALTTCFDRLRRQRARPELRWADLSEEEQDVLQHAAASTDPVDADAPRALEMLTRLLEDLPAQDAWLLREVELEQKSLADVCAATGWNGGAARVRLFRARQRLQKLISKTGAGMNANLSRLIATARKAYAPAQSPLGEAHHAPFGFSTRVVARWRGAQKRETGRTWEGLCWWGAAASIMVCLLVFVQQHQTEPTAFDLLLTVESREELELF